MVKPGYLGEFKDYVNRGRAFLALGRRNRALRIFDRAIKANPKSESALEARGETLYQRGNDAGAMRDFKAASALNPDWDVPIIGMAKALLEMDQIEQALQLLDRVLERHPGNQDALLQKSQAESRRGGKDAARALINKILQADPAHAPRSRVSRSHALERERFARSGPGNGAKSGSQSAQYGRARRAGSFAD